MVRACIPCTSTLQCIRYSKLLGLQAPTYSTVPVQYTAHECRRETKYLIITKDFSISMSSFKPSSCVKCQYMFIIKAQSLLLCSFSARASKQVSKRLPWESVWLLCLLLQSPAVAIFFAREKLHRMALLPSLSLSLSPPTSTSEDLSLFLHRMFCATDLNIRQGRTQMYVQYVCITGCFTLIIVKFCN